MSDRVASQIWWPPPELAAESRMAAFTEAMRATTGRDFTTYGALWRWSVKEPGRFWEHFARWAGLVYASGWAKPLEGSEMPGATWFPGATVNFTAQVFANVREGRTAVLHQNETGTVAELDWETLQRRVRALAGSLSALGIEEGDRVVGYLPNTPDTVVAFLACASIGAVWSLCAPDMGAPTVLERFRQIAPKAIFTVSGYEFGGRRHDRGAEIGKLLSGLPSLEHWITLDGAESVGSAAWPARIERHEWADLLARDAANDPVMVPFDHPLWVVYSSGTTGAPKAIVHGHGGVILEHLKLLGLHCDVGPGDVFAWYSSTGWIMWNIQVGGLLTGATIALAEGNPNFPDAGRLWRFIERAGVTSFGAGAAYYTGCMKAGVSPKAEANLSRLRMLGSTGSPLPPEAYVWLYDNVRPDIWIAPVAGGTDLAGAFLAANPMLPVRSGEMQCRALGAAVEAFDAEGSSLIDEVGELVCTKPMPSMPLYLWGDEDGSRLLASYFDTYPGVWRHGDWVRITSDGGAVIYGRSDATINRYGIRMGTADIYRVVEEHAEVADSLVVDLEYLGKPSCMILFLKLTDGAVLDDALRTALLTALKARVSPHHVPDQIEEAPDVPYTLTGKKLEVPIKRRLLGANMAEVVTVDAMANPDCLTWYDTFARTFLNE